MNAVVAEEWREDGLTEQGIVLSSSDELTSSIEQVVPLHVVNHCPRRPAWRQQPREISDELIASLGAGLTAVRCPTLAELAEAVGLPISEARLGLRRLAEQLKPTGIQVLDDGSHVQLAPDRRFQATVVQLVQSKQLPVPTQEQGCRSAAVCCRAAAAASS